MATIPKELNEKQKKFIQEYITNGNNGAKAYKKIYKIKDNKKSSVSAARLLAKVSIKEYIKELSAKTEKQTIITVQERMEFLTRIIYSEEKDIKFLSGLGIPVKTDPSLNEKQKAIDLLNKMQGTYVEKVEVSGEVGIKALKELSVEELRKIASDR